MKNFKEMMIVLEENESLIWEECFLIDENWITTPLKFVAGAGGNLLSQSARGFGNVAQGFVGNVGATADLGLGTLQTIGGGHKKGLERIKKGLKKVGDSGEKIGKGVTQTIGAFSGVTPLLRGAQAASEPFGVKGVYAPPAKKGSFSDLIGLGTWDDENLIKEKPSIKPPPVPPVSPKQKQQTQKKSSTNRSASNSELKKLITMYKNSKNSNERRQIQKKMAIVDPVWYQRTMRKAKERLGLTK